MGVFAVGQPVSRTEDPRLLTGRGLYINDRTLPREAQLYILRSPHAHAKINGIDTAAAASAPGVLAVLTGEDLAKENWGTTKITFPQKRPNGDPAYHAPHPGLVRDRVRFVGDHVALVIAESLNQAKDAAELVEVDYEPLTPVTVTADATKDDTPRIWDDCDNNIAYVAKLGDKEATDAAFAEADHVVSRKFVINRISANAMENRGCIGEYDAREDRYILYADLQTPHSARTILSQVLNVPERQIQVIAGNVGGAFGMKGPIYPEHRLVLWASKVVGRPVKWNADRSESLQSDEHARDNVSEASLALSKTGQFLGIRANNLASLGAYLSSDRGMLPTFQNMGVIAGTYTTKAIYVEVSGVFTNMNTTAPFRGAGRPEAAYILERLIDLAAAELKMDRTEIRRMNTIPADAMPYKTALMYTYDCGEFERNLDRVMEMIDYAGFETRREEAHGRGKLRGLGITNTIERAASVSTETVEVRFDSAGDVTVLAGSKDQGQSHDTMYKILLGEHLGIDSDRVRLIDGDTDKVSSGVGTFGSRSAVMGGSAIKIASGKLIEKGKTIAAHILEAAESDIEFEGGQFKVAGTDKSVDIHDVAKAAYSPGKMPPGVEHGFHETGVFNLDKPTFPNGAHAVELEIDPDTGETEIINYCVVDDVGNVINPLTLKGQIHGGVAMGVGQALMEDVAYDKESGQLLSGSFMDYAMPHADNLCYIAVESQPVPTDTNPLGVKGAGEAGTVGALPAVLNAVADALSPIGIDDIPMPAKPEKIWRAIQDATA